MTFDKLSVQLGTFSQDLSTALTELGMAESCQDLLIDHICVRLKDPADVDALKKELENIGRVISEVNVNGRTIMIVQLAEAIDLGQWKTFGIELPYPKPYHNYEDGWEHVEFVLKDAPNTMEGVREAFVRTFPNLDIQELRSKYSYSEDEPYAEGDQLPNPTIALKVDGVGIKFHAKSIQEVVGFE